MTDRTPEGGSDGRTGNRIEIVSTVVLALAAVAIAWSSYQASRWHGEQADTQAEIDVATLPMGSQWVDSRMCRNDPDIWTSSRIAICNLEDHADPAPRAGARSS